MNSKLIISGIALAALLSWGGTSAYGHGHGGGGGGGFSGAPVSAGSGGGHAYSGNGGYSAGMRGSTGGGFSRMHTVYGGRNYYSARGSPAYTNYGSRSAYHTGTRQAQVSRSFNSQNVHANRTVSGTNHSNRAGALNQSSRSYTNQTLRGQGNKAADHRAITTRDGRNHQGKWARNNPANKNRFDRQTQDKLRNWNGRTSDLAEARQRHQENHGDHNGDHHGNHDGHHHHGDDWWHDHCNAIVIVGGGYWGWWDGWWYPAWGYDPYYSYYEYDGPIYAYDGLPPDEAVANVQSELQNLGYYTYTVDGILGPLTREAISRYQRDRGLAMTGVIDPATVGSLGLNYQLAEAD
jgi:Putative peptidoglycan binding domain